MGNSGDAEIGRARVPPRLTGKDLLGRWLARRLALPIFSHLTSGGGESRLHALWRAHNPFTAGGSNVVE